MCASSSQLPRGLSKHRSHHVSPLPSNPQWLPYEIKSNLSGMISRPSPIHPRPKFPGSPPVLTSCSKVTLAACHLLNIPCFFLPLSSSWHATLTPLSASGPVRSPVLYYLLYEASHHAQSWCFILGGSYKQLFVYQSPCYTLSF